MRNPGKGFSGAFPCPPGFAAGACLSSTNRGNPSIREHRIDESELACQVNRLEQAIVDTRREILKVQRKVTEGLGAQDASILSAHLLVLEDPTLIEEVSRIIFEEKVTAEYAFKKVAEKYAAR